MSSVHDSGRGAIARLHDFDRRPARNLGPMQVAFFGLAAAAVVAWETPGFGPLLMLVWPAAGYVLLQFVLAFHDASHGRFHPNQRMNELFGHATGTLSFVPLAVYRHAHARHHARLGSPQDPELWPFTVPGTPRAVRVVVAVVEILFACVYTPLLFLRGVLADGVSGRERRSVVVGYAACGVTWGAILAAVEWFGIWERFVVGIIVPYALAASAQTINKYTEHLGLHGRSVLGLTRTVDPAGPAAAFTSYALLHVDAHGTHHRYAKIPHYHLPAATPYAVAGSGERCPVFPSLAAAMLDMLPCLADPKTGPQWKEGTAGAAEGRSSGGAGGDADADHSA